MSLLRGVVFIMKSRGPTISLLINRVNITVDDSSTGITDMFWKTK